MLRFSLRIALGFLTGCLLVTGTNPTSALAQGRRSFGGGGGGILEGRRGGGANSERPFGGRAQGGRNQGSGNQTNRNERNSNDGFNEDYRPSTIPHSPSIDVPPAAPAKPKPVASPAVTVRDFTPNTWLRDAAYPSRAVINRLRPELEDLASQQLDRIDKLLKDHEINRRSADLLRQTARRIGGGDDAVRDFERAFIERDPEGVQSSGGILKLDSRQLAHAVLFLSNNKLRDRFDAALADDDARSLRDFRSAAKEFRDRLPNSDLEKPYQDAALETVDALVTTFNARAALQSTLENSKPDRGDHPTWDDLGEVQVIVSPRLDSGEVYYVAPDFLLAGTQVAGPVTIVKATLAAAFGLLAFDSSATDHPSEQVSLLGEPTGVTFVNPASNGKKFSFQLNGHDFSLEPGTMLEFSNTDSQKIETFRFAATDGAAITSGFNLVEQDGTPIRKAYFRLKLTGGTWSYDRKPTLAMVPGTSTFAAPKTPVLYIRNTTTAFVPYKFGQWDMKLAPNLGQGFDDTHVTTDTTVVQFTPVGGGKPSRYTLSRGNAYQFVDRDGKIDLVPSPPYTVTIDNESSPFDFAYTLGGEPFVVKASDVRTHTFKLPPSELLVAFDAGKGVDTQVKCALEKTYYVGMNSAMRLDLFTDRSLAEPQLSELRTRQLQRDEQIASLPPLERAAPLEGIAKQSPESQREDPAPQLPPDLPVQPPERKPQAYVLAVGVSKYADSKYDLKFANRDATEFCEVFQQRAGDFYDRVHINLLCDEDATSLSVKKALHSIANDAQSGDVVVLFFSAHGFVANKRYYYLGTHDLNAEDLLSTAVKYSDVIEPIEILTVDKQCQVLLFIDTCNSDAITLNLPGKDEKGGAPVRPLGADNGSRDVSDLISRAGKGCLVFASSASGQASVENPSWRHGAFTKALLDAIASPATDTNGDGIIGVIELDPAMNKILGDLTGGKQRVHVSWPKSVKNFDLIKLPR